MSYCFDATNISVQDDGYMVMVVFADDEHDPSKFVMLQKAHKYDDQDKRLGMDKIHIQLEDESRSAYGGINAIIISPDKIKISISEQTRARLLIDGDIEIRIVADKLEFGKIASQLKIMSEADGIIFESKNTWHQKID